MKEARCPHCDCTYFMLEACDFTGEVTHAGGGVFWRDSRGNLRISHETPPEISVSQKIDAICEHLNLEIVKKTREEKIVCRWGSSAKPGPKKKEKK